MSSHTCVTGVQIPPVTLCSGERQFFSRLNNSCEGSKQAKSNLSSISSCLLEKWMHSTTIQEQPLKSWKRFQAPLTTHRFCTLASSRTSQGHKQQFPAGDSPRGCRKSYSLRPCAGDASSIQSPFTAPHTPNSPWAARANPGNGWSVLFRSSGSEHISTSSLDSPPSTLLASQ